MVSRAEAERHGLGDAVVSVCRRITLDVHSSLEAVGLTAALADRGISCNVIAGVYRDHLFVPDDRAEEAVEAFHTLGDRLGAAQPPQAGVRVRRSLRP